MKSQEKRNFKPCRALDSESELEKPERLTFNVNSKFSDKLVIINRYKQDL